MLTGSTPATFERINSNRNLSSGPAIALGNIRVTALNRVRSIGSRTRIKYRSPKRTISEAVPPHRRAHTGASRIAM